MAQALGRPTQDFVPIKEIRDGYVVLKDGSLRAIIMASTVNFALKSEDEQQAIILQFQNFLNSLDFSVEICMQSRKLDIRPYLKILNDRINEQPTDLMKMQTQEYIGFIKHFTETTNIMTKTFFIVVPYSPAVLQKKNSGPLSFFSKRKPKMETNKKEDELFEENKTQLEERLGIIEQGLVRSGVRVAQLGNEEVTEIFYKLFNPGDTERSIKVSQ